MPSKTKKKAAEASKKNQQKKKERAVSDVTFGLKNKNKSSKVMAFVQSAEKSIMNAGSDIHTRKMDEQKKQAKLARKAVKKAKDAETAALFGEALMAVSKKGPKFAKNEGKVEAKGRDHDADGKSKGGTSRAMKMMFQMDAQEMEDKLKEDPNYVPTLEDKVEAQRQQKLKELKDSGSKGTPVTEASFKVWQERKRKRKEAEMMKMVQAEMKKKKGGKGLSVLSGRELYNYKKDLFKDQEPDAATADEDANVKGEEKSSKDNNAATTVGVEAVAEKVEKDLFLDGDDDDLDDLEDD